MCGECEQTLGEASATNNVCAGGYSTSSFIVPTLYFGFIKINAWLCLFTSSLYPCPFNYGKRNPAPAKATALKSPPTTSDVIFYSI